MPTSTFFHLPDEKREKLTQAIKAELCRVSFEKASINKIVQAAGIPRGSFYQYFENKQDMLHYIMSDYQNQLIELISNSLKASDGDLFQLFEEILEFALKFALNDQSNHFCKNIFSDINVNAGFYVKHTSEEVLVILMKDILPYVNTEHMDLRSEDDLSQMILILASTCRDAFVETFMNISNYEQTKRNYLSRLALLKRGFLKDKGDIK